MKPKSKRLFLGLVSSLLLTIGFARAADQFDPMTESLGRHVNSKEAGVSSASSVPCSTGTDFLDDDTP